MFTLLLEAIHPRLGYRNVAYDVREIEEAFDFLNCVVRNGSRLLDINLLDEENGLTDLPIEAFEGEFIVPEIQRLQQQVERILSESVCTSTDYKSERIAFITRMLKIRKERNALYKNTIDSYTFFLQEAEIHFCHEPRRSRVINKYRQMIIINDRHLHKGLLLCKSLESKLQYLMK